MAKVLQKVKSAKTKISEKKQAYLKNRPHRSFRKTQPIKVKPIVDSMRRVAIDSFKIIWNDRKILLVLAFIYVLASYFFVGGVAQTDFVALKDATLEVFGGTYTSANSISTIFTSILTGAFAQDLTELQQFLAVLLILLFWLAVVWALRMWFADQKIVARDALYSSAAPLVSYLIVAVFIIIQLSPGALSVAVFNLAQSGGYMQGGIEVMMFTMAAVLLCCLSIYWISSSILALIIVTLPQMRPWRAMQIAGELAMGRRVRMLAHIVNLAFIVFCAWVICLVPALFLDSWMSFDWLPLIPIMVQALCAFSVLYVATYIYKLYRSML